MRPLPLWVRLAFAVDRAGKLLTAVVRVVLEELMVAFVSADLRPAVTSEVFRRLGWSYAPGGELHRQGLFDWEPGAFAAMGLTPGDRVLVGAAGGGREMDALTALGYATEGFDPSPLAGMREDDRIRRGSYADLVAAVRDGAGPLAPIASEAFDGIVLGWGSWNHVVTEEEQRALLAALRGRWPGATVLVSWEDDRAERHDNPVARRVRAALRGRLRTEQRTPGLELYLSAGFMHFPRTADVQALAQSVGYDIALVGGPYSHLVLQPR